MFRFTNRAFSRSRGRRSRGACPAIHRGRCDTANDDFDSATVITSLPLTDILEDAELGFAGDDPGWVSAGSHRVVQADALREPTGEVHDQCLLLGSLSTSIPGREATSYAVACYPRSYFVPPFSAGPRCGRHLLPHGFDALDERGELDGLRRNRSAPAPRTMATDSATEINFRRAFPTSPSTRPTRSTRSMIPPPRVRTSPERRGIDGPPLGNGACRSTCPRAPGLSASIRALEARSSPCSVDYYSTPQRYEFDAVAGKTYYLMFGTNGTQFGDGVLDMSFSAKGFSNVSLDAFAQSPRLRPFRPPQRARDGDLGSGGRHGFDLSAHQPRQRRAVPRGNAGRR